MKRAGVADLKLHPGKAPHWLVKRMMPMASAICEFVVDEYGTLELLKRLSDPVYFQALSNVLGYDWDSSGSTTVTCGVLKSVLSWEKHGLVGVGGKGLASRRVPDQLRALEDFGLDGFGLSEISKAVAKVDNAAVQDGYQLYQHLFFVDSEENWTVVQQGMDSRSDDARRYHWTSEQVESYIEEPHTGIISGHTRKMTLDLTSKKSDLCRRTTLDVVREEPRRVMRLFEDIKAYGETTLIPWIEGDGQSLELPSYKVIPRRMNWNAVRRAYETQPSGYEDFLFMDGVGPATVRGLSLISEMIFGSAPSWADPVRMTFAFGGKDGVPFPVPREDYDKAIQFMEQALNDAKLGRRDRVVALRRLREFAPPMLVT
ncbi:MAG: DUF763 domain-containing protein [Candidatus Thorarchaeota archaeon SMTZ1-83]|nr:MAG: hypothetical protein AM324_10755 [Candidatus Thorarchaeota archaeon SMTZ1-83]